MKTLYVALALTASAPAAAQRCHAPAGWNRPVAHVSARTAPMPFALAVGTATRLSLHPARDVILVVSSGRPSKPGTMAGLAALDVTRTGKLDIALSTAAYVDLVRDGRIVAAVGHSHGEACTGIRKIVTFRVRPGRYVIELTDAPDKSIVIQATQNGIK